MKRATAGLRVRVFSVTMFTDHGRAEKSTGRILTELQYATERGIVVMKSPFARKWVMTEMDNVMRLPLGMARPRARQASARFR